VSKLYNCTNHELLIPNVVNSDGVFLYDESGKKYMDLESGVWCMSLGHKNVKINNLIKKQIDSAMHSGFCYSSNIVQESAESVLSITDFKDGKCVFLNSGGESIELARQISKHITKKKISMTFHDSYLGSFSSLTNRDQNWHLFDWKECEICLHRGNCKVDCKKLQNIPEDISEFIFEPGSSSGFVKFPPISVVENIVNIVRKNGGKIVADEVTTGIGRSGKWFGYIHYQIQPDIVAIGKGIGNGYPVSVIAINGKTIKELETAGTFRYAQSHQNDPLGAAIVNKVITVIKEDELITEAEIKGAKFLKMLQTLKDDDSIIDVRGRGLMFAIDICDEHRCSILFKKLIDKGYVVSNRKTLFRVDPPLTITEKEFEAFITDFKEILREKLLQA